MRPAVPATLSDLDALFTFAAWMHETRGDATEATVAAVRASPGQDLDGRVGAMCRPLLGPSGRQSPSGSVRRLRALDAALRSQVTVPVGLEHPLIAGQPQRLRVLGSELKRTCLWSVVRALGPTPRAVFILGSVLGWLPGRIAAVLELSPEAVERARRRAVGALGDYLGTRCEHLDPRNMCRCQARLGVALEQRFIRWPDHDEHGEVRSSAATGMTLPELYAGLPRFRLDAWSAARLAAIDVDGAVRPGESDRV